VIIWVMPFW